MGGKEEPKPLIGTAAKNHRGQLLIISMSCVVCRYEITCGGRKMTKQLLHSRQCTRPLRDWNNNTEDGTGGTGYNNTEGGTREVQDATKMPNLPNDDERVREYEWLSGNIVWNGHNGDDMMDGRVMVSQDRLSQWHYQVVENWP